MSSKVPTHPGTRMPIHPHSKQHCLKILQKLSAYLDDELSGQVCAEIRSHLGACPNCEIFLDSLRQTITLCRHHQPHPLSSTARAALRRQILKSVASA
ncbi:MAG TPA: zf-HC2 domain-containing protein [Nitrospiraceae bacterium]|nr:zf-HC2 domain-containing protein [Nitrospiraceae bacterium]